MKSRSSLLARSLCVLALVSAASLTACSAPTKAASAAAPVYIHMNGANDFLESTVAVAPGQPVTFVNEDTGAHSVVGYYPTTGAMNPKIDAALPGTPGIGHPVPTVTFAFRKPGIYAYYCSVHAHLVKTLGTAVIAVARKGIDGFGASMSGIIIVTTDAALLDSNPSTSSQKVLKSYFGG